MKLRTIADTHVTYRAHLSQLLNWLLREVETAGGDGDAAWVVKGYDINDIHEFVTDTLSAVGGFGEGWQIGPVRDDALFTVHRDPEECLLVTIRPSDVPSWSQCTITL